MNTSLIYRYPLDGTGVSPDNKVIGEEHQLSNRTVRVVAPTYGGFYADSVVVRDLNTGVPLIRTTDYIFGELFEFPTGRYGKEIFGIIAIKKQGVTAISIDYQVLGGDYSYSMAAIIEMIDSLDLGDRPADWGSIIGRPTAFPPASHFHDAGDVYGFEYLVHSVERVRQAILLGDTASHDEIYKYIDTITDGFGDDIDALTLLINTHASNTNNPHNTTKTHVGLGNVQNYGIATQAQMNTGTANNVYLTPVTVATYVTNMAVIPLAEHAARHDNPHQTTKAHVGLNLVENYPPVNEAIALAATSEAHYMTPRWTAEMVDRRALDIIEAHTSRTDNPHNTTKAQVGLGNVENYAMATSPQAIAGALTTAYMSPKTVKDAVDAWYAAGNFDSRYIRKDAAGVSSSITVVAGVGMIWIDGAWRQFYPAVWQ